MRCSFVRRRPPRESESSGETLDFLRLAASARAGPDGPIGPTLAVFDCGPDRSMIGAHRVILVVALAAEARPLIRHFDLAREPRRLPFTVYRNRRLTLVRSGVGAPAAAAAVESAAALERHAAAEKAAPRAWLNVGVAGGDELLPGVPASLGEAALAARIEGPSGRAFELPILLDTDLPPAIVRTVEEPERRYREAGLYEMEAFGFISAASRLSPPGLVQVLKVVSDSSTSPADELTAPVIEERIVERCGEIAAVVDGLLELTGAVPGRPGRC